jgi:hypothetical protein
MPHTKTRSRKPAAAALVILLLACIGLAACGGSSSTSTSTNAAATAASGTSSTATTSTGASSTPGTGRGSARFAATRECLQKNGVTLPKRTPGSGGGAFLGAGGGPALPKGMTRAQFEAALRKCGGGDFGARFGGAGRAGFRRINSPAFRQSLTKYAACLRQNGINLPAPNTSGKGPIFSTKGIVTTSPQFRAATMKCRASLVTAFRRPPGAGEAASQAGQARSSEASR